MDFLNLLRVLSSLLMPYGTSHSFSVLFWKVNPIVIRLMPGQVIYFWSFFFPFEYATDLWLIRFVDFQIFIFRKRYRMVFESMLLISNEGLRFMKLFVRHSLINKWNSLLIYAYFYYYYYYSFSRASTACLRFQFKFFSTEIKHWKTL